MIPFIRMRIDMVNNNTILGIPCMCIDYTHINGDIECCLVGKYGIIYPYDTKGNYFIIITNKDIAETYLNPLDYYTEGEEIGIILAEKETEVWIKRLKIPKTVEAQVKLWKK